MIATCSMGRKLKGRVFPFSLQQERKKKGWRREDTKSWTEHEIQEVGFRILKCNFKMLERTQDMRWQNLDTKNVHPQKHEKSVEFSNVVLRKMDMKQHLAGDPWNRINRGGRKRQLQLVKNYTNPNLHSSKWWHTFISLSLPLTPSLILSPSPSLFLFSLT